LIHCTNEMNVSIPQLADTLFERTANSSWVVVFKALIATHHLMMYGNEAASIRPVRTGLLTEARQPGGVPATSRPPHPLQSERRESWP
ncbi:hypothetical protein KUCAC02_000365, partial [Chaenocephalus aceratus]